MSDKIIAIDFAGTLFLPSALDEAQRLRSAVLSRALPTKEEHADSEKLYTKNRKLVSEVFGVKDDQELIWRDVDGDAYYLKGSEIQNIISTNLFQLGMYQVAAQSKLGCYPEGIVEALEKLKEEYSLAIISGVRTDIISGVLAISGFPVEFDYILGQPPMLGVSNEEQLAALSEDGEVVAVIGDKRSDLEPAPSGAKRVLVTWGTPQGGEDEVADVTIDSAEQLPDSV